MGTKNSSQRDSQSRSEILGPTPDGQSAYMHWLIFGIAPGDDDSEGNEEHTKGDGYGHSESLRTH